MHRSLAVALALTALASAHSPAHPASFGGRDVDGHWYTGSITSHQAGRYEDCRIQFHGDRIRVRLPSGATVIAFMEEESIADPHEIACYDPKRSLHWVVDVADLDR